MVVIGWALGVDGKVRPITADWNEDIDSNNTILHPNGTVENFSTRQTFDSLADWLEAEREE
mgnify:CR=1 FL=1